MNLDIEELNLLRRALEVFEDRCTRLHKGSTHEPLRKVYRKDLDAIEALKSKLLEAVL